MNGITYDLDSAQMVFKCLKIGKTVEKPFTCYVNKNQIVFMKQCDYGRSEVKYKLPIELSTHIKWDVVKQQENGQKMYHLLSFKFSQNDIKSGSKIKWFKGCEGDLLNLKKLLLNRVLFQHVQDFYTPLQTLGKGSSARILLVRHKLSEKFYAAKCIDKTYVNDSENGLVQMYQEISIQRELEHPTLIKLHEVYEGDNTFYMVMDLMKGNSLFEELKNNRGSFPMSIVESIMKQIMTGIEYIHSKGIIHRDIKPENIVFCQKNDFNSLKIVDFGLATRMDVDQYLFPKCGTPGFVAPEVANLVDKSYKYDKVCDIFSAGAIFYQMVSGQQLFPGNGFNIVLKLNKKCQINSTPLQLKKVPKDIINLILRMLESDPNKRLQASEVLKDPFFTHKVIQPSAAHKKIFFQSHKKDTPVAQTVDLSLNSDEQQNYKHHDSKDQIMGSFVVKENLYIGLNANQVQQNKSIFNTTELNKKSIFDTKDLIFDIGLQEEHKTQKIEESKE